MTRFTSLLGLLALLVFVAPVAAQEETPPVSETPDTVAPETPDALAEETPDTAEVASTHDWEFALQANDASLDATANVLVTEGDPQNTFVVEATGLPAIDQLDTETRDVNAYTVWIAPSKDKVQESTLAGALSVDPEGNARFEGKTDLDTFGILILATENGAPESLSGIPVLTGIPAPEAAAADAAGEAAEAADQAAGVADEAADQAEQAADQAEEAAEDAAEAADKAEEAVPPADEPEAAPQPEN